MKVDVAVDIGVPLMAVRAVRGWWVMNHTVETQQWLVAVLSLCSVIGTVPVVVAGAEWMAPIPRL